MYGLWQDQIDGELRALRRVEAREHLNVEDQILCAGHLDQQAVPGQPLPGTRAPVVRVTVRRILAGVGRA